jgi:hypothetical protein
MTVAKHRCTSCKKHFDAGSMIKVTAGKFCKQSCLISYGMTKTDKLIKSAKKEKKKVNAKQKRDYYDNDKTTREKAAHDACHLWIKIRDKGDLCICCNKPIGEQGNAGHFHESGNNSRIRYDEDNIHYQRIYCNMYKGGDSDDYRGNLIKKIGIDRVERLDSLKGGTVKRTCEDYKTIENYYKDKIKHHKQQIGD